MSLVVVVAALALLGLLGMGGVLLRPLLPRLRLDEDDDRLEPGTVVLFGHPGARRPAEPAAGVAVGARHHAAEGRRRAPTTSPSPRVADVLLVTGDAARRGLRNAVLSGRRCSVRDVAPGHGVAVAIRAGVPDLVLVDAATCESAVQLVRTLRAWAVTETVPIVLLGGDDRSLGRRADGLGVTDVVVGAERLPGLVERALPYWLEGSGVFRTG